MTPIIAVCLCLAICLGTAFAIKPSVTEYKKMRDEAAEHFAASQRIYAAAGVRLREANAMHDKALAILADAERLLHKDKDT